MNKALHAKADTLFIIQAIKQGGIIVYTGIRRIWNKAVKLPMFNKKQPQTGIPAIPPIEEVIHIDFWGGRSISAGEIVKRIDVDKEMARVRRLTGKEDRGLVMTVEFVD